MSSSDKDSLLLLKENKLLQSRISKLNNKIIKLESQLKVKSNLHKSQESAFLASISHELRTPINGILGLNELLLQTELTEEQRDLAETTKESAQSLLTVLNDVLDISRVEAGKLTLCNEDFLLKSFINSVINLFKGESLKKNIEIKLQESKNLPNMIKLDNSRLRQILVNLIGNAIKFSRSESKIEISIENIGEINGAPNLKFTVKDYGIGIAKSRQSQIFKAFTQADSGITRQYGGTGLGLTISSKLVAIMNGTIGLKSKLGKGSSFFVTLPYQLSSTEHTPQLDILSDLTKEQDLSKLKVLVAEDNLVNQKVITHILENLGCTVYLVSDGDQAIQNLKEELVDIILMDIQMPNMSGDRAIQLIRQLEDPIKSKVPIVVLTAYSPESDKEHFNVDGANAYLPKPISREHLIQTINRFITVNPPIN